MLFLLQAIATRTLYTIKVANKEENTYLKDMPNDEAIIFTKEINKAKKFWVQQNTIDPNFIKIHCDNQDNNLLTVRNEKSDYLVYAVDDPKDLMFQQFLIYRSPKYKEGELYIYLIQYKDMFLTKKINDDDSISLTLQEEQNDNFDDQEFEFESVDGNKSEAPTRFLWDKIQYDEHGVPEIILGPSKVMLDELIENNEIEGMPDITGIDEKSANILNANNGEIKKQIGDILQTENNGKDLENNDSKNENESNNMTENQN
ncbi:hypothetical protein COBT_002829 [Conglomerata obtusa]